MCDVGNRTSAVLPFRIVNLAETCVHIRDVLVEDVQLAC